MGVRLTVRLPSTPDSASDEVVFELEQPRVVIGRGAGADVRLPHPSVSRTHALIELGSEGYTLRDGGTTNGTRVNGSALVPGRSRALRTGDELAVGIFELRFEEGPPRGEPTVGERGLALTRRLLDQLLPGDDPALAPPTLEVVSGAGLGHVLRLDRDGSWTLGTDAQADFRVDTGGAPGATVRSAGARVTLEPLRPPTAARPQRLRHGDEVALGQTRLRFTDPGAQRLAQLEAAPDEPYERPTPPPTTPAPVTPDAPPAQPAPARPRRPREVGLRSELGADAVIYLLAAAILMTSLAGLTWLIAAR